MEALSTSGGFDLLLPEVTAVLEAEQFSGHPVDGDERRLAEAVVAAASGR